MLAEYDVHPSSTDTDGFALGAGILWQPSAACSETPGLHVAAGPMP